MNRIGGVRLTPRELEVVQLVCEDQSYQKIADKLGISPKTVEQYIRRIADRLPAELEGATGARAIRRYFNLNSPAFPRT